MFSTVKDISHAILNSGQNSHLLIDTSPKLSDINLVIWLLYAVASGKNKLTSSGWSRWVECGGRINKIIQCWSAHSINFKLTWLECPSTIRSRRRFPALVLVYGWNTFCNHSSPSWSQLHPFAVVAKYAWSPLLKSWTHESYKSCKSPWYMRSGGSFVPSAQMHASRLRNSRLPSCDAPIIRPFLYASSVMIRLSVCARPSRKPFSSQLYRFSAVMLYFSTVSINLSTKLAYT